MRAKETGDSVFQRQFNTLPRGLATMDRINPEDFIAVDAEYGPLANDASGSQAADCYRLAQANKLIRLNSAAIAEQRYDGA